MKLGGIEVFVLFDVRCRSGKGKEEGVAPSSSDLLGDRPGGGCSRILFFPHSSSHSSSVGCER